MTVCRSGLPQAACANQQNLWWVNSASNRKEALLGRMHEPQENVWHSTLRVEKTSVAFTSKGEMVAVDSRLISQFEAMIE